MSLKLNQIIAIEKGEKSRHNSQITKHHKASKQESLFNGFSKTYFAKDEDGECFPDESFVVQMNVDAGLDLIGKSLTDLFNVVATKDFGNTTARADVVVDGDVLISQVPPTFLLFLEKQLCDIRAFVSELPVLDPSESWNLDTDSGLYKADMRKTHKTRKVEKPVVLYDATEHHPAQTQMVTTDEIIGYWHTTKISGAMQATRKKVVLDRIAKLIKAVKFAREEANGAVIDRVEVNAVIDYLFK